MHRVNVYKQPKTHKKGLTLQKNTCKTITDTQKYILLISLDTVHSSETLQRCNNCSGCHQPDCGKCRYCLDKVKFGGEGKLKQGCTARKCQNWDSSNDFSDIGSSKSSTIKEDIYRCVNNVFTL